MFSMALFYIYLHMTFSRFIDKSVKGQGVPQRCILSTICPLISLIFQENIKICTYRKSREHYAILVCLFVCFPQSCTYQDLLSRNVLDHLICNHFSRNLVLEKWFYKLGFFFLVWENWLTRKKKSEFAEPLFLNQISQTRFLKTAKIESAE